MPHILMSLFKRNMSTVEDNSPGTETSNTIVLGVGKAQMCHK